MLHALLRLIQTGPARTTRELAAALAVSETLVEQMLRDLAARGYVQLDALCAAESNCGGCALHAACGARMPLKLWTLTEKGQAAGEK